MPIDPIQYAINGKASLNFVMSYLMHGCFEETLKALVGCIPNINPGAMENDKKAILECVLSSEAIDLIEKVSPDLLKSNTALFFDLLIIHFIKLVSSGNRGGALKFAETNFTPFLEMKDNAEKIHACMELLVHEKPEDIHPMPPLLRTKFRQQVADRLDAGIQVMEPLATISASEWKEMGQRKAIMKHVLERKGMEAISLTNERSPGLLDNNNEIHFELLRLHLIELVSSGKPSEAIDSDQIFLFRAKTYQSQRVHEPTRISETRKRNNKALSA